MKFDGIIFDMDGVLIDESRSYRYAIEMTVNFVLRQKNIKKEVTQEDVGIIKSIPGFNNDWDVSFVLVKMFKQKVDKENYQTKVRLVTPKLRKSKKYLQVKDIFQSYYLGEKLFQEIYNRPPPLSYLKGLNLNDSLLIDEEFLILLARKYKLGVATSRPRIEALFAARNLKITPKYIKEDLIIAKEDAVREKPEPEPLLKAKKRMGIKTPVYIGDTINDVIAAQKAGMPCIFIGLKTPERWPNGLLSGGGIYKQFNNVNQIKEIFL